MTVFFKTPRPPRFHTDLMLTLFLVFAMGAAAGETVLPSFFAGCWEIRAGAFLVEEQWMRPAGGLMLGMSRTVRGGKAVSSEFLRVEPIDGDVFYVAVIGGRSTRFRMIKLTADEAVFENKEHDFPQRILYRKTADGLAARIEGSDKGKERGQDFPYKRAACP